MVPLNVTRWPRPRHRTGYRPNSTVIGSSWRRFVGERPASTGRASGARDLDAPRSIIGMSAPLRSPYPRGFWQPSRLGSRLERIRARRMRHEICDRHFARHCRRHRTREKSNEKQSAARELDDAREAKQRKQLELIEHCDMWKMKSLAKPCCKNGSAAAMRSAPSTRGDQAARAHSRSCRPPPDLC
jgi:hypothetical protein